MYVVELEVVGSRRMSRYGESWSIKWPILSEGCTSWGHDEDLSTGNSNYYSALFADNILDRRASRKRVANDGVGLSP